MPAVPPLVYLDAGAAEPLHPAAYQLLGAASERGYADPLAGHGPGREARLLLDNARAAVAQALGVRTDEVTFTGSGTQAVHLGVLGLLLGRTRVSRTLVTSAVEHSSVLAAGRWWADTAGGSVEVLAVDRAGRVVLPPPGTAEPGAVALQQANPEVGTLQPLAEATARWPGVPLFVDACAVAGRLPLPAGWSAAALSAHQWGGPAGVGILLVRRGVRWRPPFPVDERTDPRTVGFENVPGALAAAAALQARVAEREELADRHRALTARILETVRALPDVEVHGHPDERLPHLVSFSCLYVDGEALVSELDRRGVAVASGSACTASALEPSHVLVAMGALTHGNVRVGLGRSTTAEDVDRLIGVLPGVLVELRERVGL